jgi:hypothetical protein
MDDNIPIRISTTDLEEAGRKAKDARNFQGPLELFQEGISQDPESSGCWSGLAECYEWEFETRKAIEARKNVISFSSTFNRHDWDALIYNFTYLHT